MTDNVIHHHDARDMSAVESDSVALVVTSPPYNVGKEYEAVMSHDEHLELLLAVFRESVRVLEPGGRIAVNVGNVGRRPHLSLSSAVINIFADLGLLLRGEIIWQKGPTMTCAWGSFRHPANPVLRDTTERVVVASKGSYDRIPGPVERFERRLPYVSTISKDEFLAATLDLWTIRPESAKRIGHPAPFPVKLPRRLIELYTYRDDVVLDPFMGSGTTAVAAVQTGRRYIGFETEQRYIDLAKSRITQTGTEML